MDFIAHLGSSLPIISGLIRHKYLSLSSKLIIVFFLFYFTKETFVLWLSILKENNLYLQNIETIIETWLLLWIGFSCFKSHKWRWVALGLAISSSLASFLTYQSDGVSSVSLSSFRLFAIFFCLSYFNKILTDTRVKNILLHTLFWFSAGLLVYVAGTFFIVLFSEYWYKDINKVPAEVFDKYWNASQILFIIFCLFSAYGLWTSKYDQKNLL